MALNLGIECHSAATLYVYSNSQRTIVACNAGSNTLLLDVSFVVGVHPYFIMKGTVKNAIIVTGTTYSMKHDYFNKVLILLGVSKLNTTYFESFILILVMYIWWIIPMMK